MFAEVRRRWIVRSLHPALRKTWCAAGRSPTTSPRAAEGRPQRGSYLRQHRQRLRQAKRMLREHLRAYRRPLLAFRKSG